MSMSDCSKCWSTPCACGHEYKNYTDDKMVELLQGMLSTRPELNRKEILLKVMSQ